MSINRLKDEIIEFSSTKIRHGYEANHCFPAFAYFHKTYEKLANDLALDMVRPRTQASYQMSAESISLLRSLFLDFFDEVLTTTGSLSEDFAHFTYRNITSEWRSIRSGGPIEIELDIRDLWVGDYPLREYFAGIIDSLQKKYDSNRKLLLDELSAPLNQSESVIQRFGEYISYAHRQEISAHLGYDFSHCRVSGVVKLHPVGVNDTASQRFHTDGDNSLVKFIFYLEDNERDIFDGAFATLPTFYTKRPNFLRLSFLQRLLICGHFLRANDAYSSHPLCKLYNYVNRSHSESNHNEIIAKGLSVRTYPITSGTGVAFSGSYVLHKGGDNLRARRPVIQGYLHCL
jgi:hypothetical protein